MFVLFLRFTLGNYKLLALSPAFAFSCCPTSHLGISLRQCHTQRILEMTCRFNCCFV